MRNQIDARSKRKSLKFSTYVSFMHSQTKGANLRPRRANAAVLQEARARLICCAHNEYGIQMTDVTAGQPEGLYFRQLPVRRLGRNQSSQGAESRVHAAQRRSHFFSRAPASQHPKRRRISLAMRSIYLIRVYLVRYVYRYCIYIK